MRFEKILPPNSKRRELVKKICQKCFKAHNEEEYRYQKWIMQNEPNKKELQKQRNHEFKINPKISILVPLYNTPEKFFDELVKSLQNQTYSNWQLCLADGSPQPIKFMDKYLSDERISYSIIGENKGISGNTNEALKLATGDYIALLDHDDLLPIFSLYEIVKAINENPDVEFIYTDEDKLEDTKSPRYGVFFKPDFSPYTLNSANYICHFSIFKKELMDKLGGFKSEYDGSQDFDIVARATELTDKVVHIPKVLYHWRVHQNSTAGNSDSKPYAFEVGKKVIKDHVKRSSGRNVEVTDGLTPGSYELKYEVKNNPKVSIIVDSSNLEKEDTEKLLEKVKVTTYTNYETIVINKEDVKENNIFEAYQNAVKKAEGEYFIIVDEDLLQIDRETYIEELVGICQDETVGMVGTKLYNEENLVEHCGIILGMNGCGDFLYKGAPKDIGTYMQRLTIIHNVSCVFVKYAMIDKKIFDEVNGFNTNYNNILESIELCIKMLNKGKQIVLNPIVSIKVKGLKNAEKPNEEKQKEFIEKWKENYDKKDQFFSSNLSYKDTGLSFNVK